MSFDQSTLPAIAVFSSAVAGCLLLLSWLQHRLVTALALWGIAFLMAAVATALLAARGLIPDALSIVIANALLAAAYSTMWWGVRSFEGRRTRLVFVLAGTLVWLCGCVFPAFYETPVARAVLIPTRTTSLPLARHSVHHPPLMRRLSSCNSLRCTCYAVEWASTLPRPPIGVPHPSPRVMIEGALTSSSCICCSRLLGWCSWSGPDLEATHVAAGPRAFIDRPGPCIRALV